MKSEEIKFVNYWVRVPNDTTTIAVPNGYPAGKVWCTVNGIDIPSGDYTATDGTIIVFHFGGNPGNGLAQDDSVWVHGIEDNSGFNNGVNFINSITKFSQYSDITHIDMNKKRAFLTPKILSPLTKYIKGKRLDFLQYEKMPISKFL